MKALGKLASEPLWTGSVTTVILDIYGDHVAEVDALRQSYTLDIELKPHRKRRSLDAVAEQMELPIANELRELEEINESWRKTHVE